MVQTSNPLSVFPEALPAGNSLGVAPPSQYSPEVQSYVDKINAHIAAQKALGYEAKMTNIVGPQGSSNPYENLMAAGVDPTSLVEVGQAFKTNRGNAAKVKNNMSGVVYDVPGAQYRLTNEMGKNQVVYEGSGLAGLTEAKRLAGQLSEDGGKKANWGLEVQYPGAQWTRMADDDPAKNTLGKIADIALPLALSLIAPGLGLGIGAIGAGAAGAAAGSALSGAAQGRSLSNILKSAALSGGLSFAGGTLLSKVAPGLSSVGGSAATNSAASGVTNAASQGLGGAVGDIVVNGVRNTLPGAIGAGIGGVAGGLAAGSLTPDAPYDGLTVNARPLPPPVNPGAIVGGTAGALVPDILPGDIVSNGTRPQAPPPNPGAIIGGALAPEVIPKDVANSKNTDGASDGKGFDWSKLPQYMQLAALVGGGLEGLLKGGGSSATVPGGFGGGNLGSVFNATLPTNPVVPGTGGLRADQLGPRVMPAQDWTKYAMNPEQSFFKQVPHGPAYMARGGHLEGDGASNQSLEVRGPGDGRDDTVPAMLSDGEYVIDAETVALLGDGSNKAGADRLDEFRVNLRKHKGRELSRGKISADAKPVVRYIGGRA